MQDSLLYYKMLLLLKKVANEILKAVTSEQPEPRHTVGDDAAGTLQQKEQRQMCSLES